MEEIVVTFPGKKGTLANYKGFEIRTAQPADKGGDGSALGPFDLFLVSIATCSATYVVYFCEKRGIPADNIRVVQKMERDPETKMVTRVTLTVELPPDFPGKYIDPMLKSVNLCTVKKHILDPPEFVLTSRTAG